MSIPNFYIDSSNAYRNSMYDFMVILNEVCPEIVYLWEDSRFLCEWIAVNDVLNACTEREGGC